ncbi:glycoside hydrolase family 88 protein [Aspergillus alliaceus]|uniref:glycoside hydrolase family 88 protein n=1 Tax=Petromyces alliaceus TaxID=209559 RepID=UPI0012A52E88|nr:Six-hairpin glycosidase-like protein [Aspergillus alliaceus]KAB8230280.1 Six-hairpin glycosidase-like protein [Aspergillus alliaceus]
MAPHILGSSPDIESRPTYNEVTKPLYSPKTRDSDLRTELAFLFRENNIAKLIDVAEALLERDGSPIRFPETVPQTGTNQGVYRCRDAEFWTCGFFPGSLYCLLERMRKHPGASLSGLSILSKGPQEACTGTATRGVHIHDILVSHITTLCGKWSEPLHAMSFRKDTHDLGFIIQPALQRDWELFGSKRSLESVLTAAENLASRFDEQVGAIRSWDRFSNACHEITSMEDDFLVIIDSLCNLDLLFYAGNYLRSKRLLSIAETHASTLLSSHLRPEFGPDGETFYSTYHVVNFSPTQNGAVKQKLTAQGYSDNSTWARGQAWAILGYAQTFAWTKRQEHLNAAKSLADYFIFRMETSPSIVEQGGRGRYVPLWDFDAPITNTSTNGEQCPLRDVSAGLIAANGILILYGQLTGMGDHATAKRYLEYTLAIAKDTVALAYNRDEMQLSLSEQDGKIRIATREVGNGCRFEAVLEKSTANYNANHADRHWDHGLVYADYYFLELGNRLLDMGLV